MNVRRMLPHELEAAVGVWHAANVARNAPHGAERMTRVRAKLAASDALAFVALRPKVVGMALAEPGRFNDGAGGLDPTLLHISMVFVHPAAQGTRVGSSLALYVLDAARLLGYQRASVWTYVDNTAARKLYEGVGMAPTGERARVRAHTQIQYGCVLGESAARATQTAAVAAGDEPIRLCPYDPAWPARFEEERVALKDAIGESIVDGIHHVGSTAVAGLEAKPIIDILVGVPSLDESRECFEPLARLDYVYAPYLSEEMHWFCKPHPSRRTHHLHLVPVGAQRYVDELAFRDRLRDDPEIAAEYLTLKRDLARRFANDREAYTEAKSGFIRHVLGQGP